MDKLVLTGTEVGELASYLAVNGLANCTEPAILAIVAKIQAHLTVTDLGDGRSNVDNFALTILNG